MVDKQRTNVSWCREPQLELSTIVDWGRELQQFFSYSPSDYAFGEPTSLDRERLSLGSCFHKYKVSPEQFGGGTWYIIGPLGCVTMWGKEKMC